MGFQSSVAPHLTSYRWPGNVRELESRIKRAVVLASGPIVYPSDLFETADNELPLPSEDIDEPEPTGTPDDIPFPTYKVAKARFARRYPERLMASTRGNVSEA